MEVNEITSKFLARLEATLRQSEEKVNPISNLHFSFSILNSQIDYFSDKVDLMETVVNKIEDSFLDSTPHLTDEVIDVDDLKDNFDRKNAILSLVDKKVACTLEEAYNEGNFALFLHLTFFGPWVVDCIKMI